VDPSPLERLSVELTNRCAKGCSFCYNASHPEGPVEWALEELVAFVEDVARHGVRAVSFGGGEPLEYAPLFPLLARLRGTLFRSLTTNGLLLDEPTLDALAAVAPEKVHVSIHFPEKSREIERALGVIAGLEARGIRAGVNLLVARSKLDAAAACARALENAGIASERIVYLPMRVTDVPSAEEVARVADRRAFQSTTCLAACARSPRFVAVSWDKTVAHCSYTSARERLPSLDFAGLRTAAERAGLVYCGEERHERLVRLSRGPQHGYDLVRDR
jgi:MoaA/NifB/PqqE/SkfB family radical SAM enzyme